MAALPVFLLLAAASTQVVRSVRLELAHEARYREYVQIAPGQAFDPAAIREAVKLLFATGEFEDVLVLAERDEQGVDLVFRPLPAPLLRKVIVLGDHVVSAGQLLRMARLRPREPLFPKRLEAASRDATEALVEAGYLAAAVTLEARRSEAGADAVFHVQAGRRAQLRFARTIGFSGPPALEELMRPLHGEIYRRAQAAEARERMRRRLAEAGHWRAQVTLEERYAPGSRYVDLEFQVDAGPLMSLAFQGGEVPGSLRRSLVSLLRDGEAKQDALEAGVEALESYFHARGHRDVRVRYELLDSPAGQTLRYELEPGPAASVASVAVAGAGSVPFVPKTQPGAALREDRLTDDARRLREALEARGHAEAKVEVEVGEGGGLLGVVFRVRPGPLTTVSEVVVEGAPSELATPELSLRASRPYRVADLAADTRQLLNACRNAGYPAVVVEPELLFSDDHAEVKVRLLVNPGPRALVDQVVIAGLDRTRETVVRRELLIGPGRPLAIDRLLESQRRLSALGLFDRVSLKELDTSTGPARNVVVNVSEASTTAVTYGVGYSERELVRGSLEVARRNLFGMDRTLTAFGRGSFRGSRFVLSYREPYFLRRKQDLYVTGFYEDEDRISFDFTRKGGLLQTARALHEHDRVILRLTYQATDVFHVEVPLEEVDRQFRTYTLAGPAASFVEDTRDDPLDARRGRFLGADLQLSLRALGGASFAKGYFQGAHHQPLNSHLSLAISARAGLAATFGAGEPDQLPLPERFFAGGDYTIRGFEMDTVGPQQAGQDGQLFPTGGNALLLGNLELRRDLGRSLTFATFLDIGNVYPRVADMTLQDLRYTAGLGFRYRTPLGPLRLDWGYKLNPRLGESPYRFHLTIGNAY